MDLYMIVIEFEAYHELKFGKTPKLVKKLDEKSKGSTPSFPKIAPQSGKSNSVGTADKTPPGGSKPPAKTGKNSASKSKDSGDQKTVDDSLDLGI